MVDEMGKIVKEKFSDCDTEAIINGTTCIFTITFQAVTKTINPWLDKDDSIEKYRAESVTRSRSSTRSGSKGSIKLEDGQQLLLEFFIPDSTNCIYFPEERFLSKLETGSIKIQILTLIKIVEQLSENKELSDNHKKVIRNAIYKNIFNEDKDGENNLTKSLNNILSPTTF